MATALISNARGQERSILAMPWRSLHPRDACFNADIVMVGEKCIISAQRARTAPSKKRINVPRVKISARKDDGNKTKKNDGTRGQMGRRSSFAASAMEGKRSGKKSSKKEKGEVKMKEEMEEMKKAEKKEEEMKKEELKEEKNNGRSEGRNESRNKGVEAEARSSRGKCCWKRFQSH